MAVNMKIREYGSQSFRKLKMAPIRFKEGSHFGSRIFRVYNSIDITLKTTYFTIRIVLLYIN